DVEDAGAPGERADAAAVLALVEVHAGLLPVQRVDLEGDAVLTAGDGAAGLERRPPHHPARRGEALHLREAPGRHLDDAREALLALEGIVDRLLAALHAERGELHRR